MLHVLLKYTWNYWRVKYLANHSKIQLASILIGGFEYCMEKICAYSLNSVHLI